MQTLQGLEALRRLPARSVLAIGNFDGVHLGHRRILQVARQLADADHSQVAVVTFEPHPLTVLRPERAPLRLTPPTVKQSLISQAGGDFLIVLPPQPEVLGLSAENFWKILRDEVRAAHLVEGPTFRFGKGAAGSIELLQKWTVGSPVTLHVVESVSVPLMDLQVVPVNSSLIRFLLSNGRARDAAVCLGRPYLLSGTVGKGFARGRELGVPTANLKCDDQLIPPDGVYAGKCTVDGRAYPAGVSIGTMPTFGENVRQVEAHLVGFDGDLYGQHLGVELLDWIREQRKYSAVQPLKAQMERDISLTTTLAGRDASRPIASLIA
jgi:riboflavin kinase / FMN adenylyltransferase